MNRIAGIAPRLRLRPVETDDQQMLKLFWNRAELKKELGRLRRERDQLLAQLRQEEQAQLRCQQRLEQLESLLADPLQAANAAVYYQLRGVWQLCHRRLARLARELADRQQEREELYARQLFDRQREADFAAADQNIAEIERQVRVIEAEQRQLAMQVRAWRGFWHYSRRQVAASRAASLGASLDGLSAQLDVLRTERQRRERELPPGIAGLSVEGRRNINLVIIAAAQQLLLHFLDMDVAGLSRESVSRGLAELCYGDVEHCRELGRLVAAVVARLDHADKLNGQIRRRAEYLRRGAQYRNDAEVVPAPASFPSVATRIPDAGEAAGGDVEAPVAVNILSDDYWDIRSVLLV